MSSCWSGLSVATVSKYDPLLQYLARSDKGVITLSFAQIEDLLGTSLPPSARCHHAWWANQQVEGHVQSNSWMDAGFRAENLDLNGRKVSFRKVGKVEMTSGSLAVPSMVRVDQLGV